MKINKTERIDTLFVFCDCENCGQMYPRNRDAAMQYATKHAQETGHKVTVLVTGSQNITVSK